MREYPKIETLFERDDKFRVIPGRLKREVYGTVKTWIVTEKVDGTNIRVGLEREGNEDKIRIGGRTDNAQLPSDFLMQLVNLFPVAKLAALRKDPVDPVSITLYGEGYGAGIQKGGGYRADKGFILFDVLIENRWWLKEDAVTEIAEKLGIPRVPVIGVMDIPMIAEAVSGGLRSCLPGATCQAEGVVARTIEPLFDTQGKRLILKLKTKDFGLATEPQPQGDVK